MASAIEDLLFPGAPAYVVTALTLTPSRITLAVAPWGLGGAVREFAFEQACVTELAAHTEAETEAFALPWLVVGCKCEQLAENRWRFLLYAGGNLLEFEANWPVLVVP
jgi:hypothetical protein